MVNVRQETGKVDKPLLVLLCVLIVLGFWMVYTATAYSSSSASQLSKQAIGILVGIIIAVLLVNQDPKKMWSNFWFNAIPYVGLIILLIITAFFGPIINGATRWIPVAGFTLQPSEFFKPILVLGASYYLFYGERKLGANVKSDLYILGFLMLLVAIPIGLIFKQPDLGTCVVLGIAFICLLIFNGIRARIAWALSLLFGLGIFLSIRFSPYRMERISDWWKAMVNPTDMPITDTTAFQIKQALIAIGNGGTFGQGAAAGKQKAFLPAYDTDFIFAVIAEDYGFLGTVCVVMLFVILFHRCIIIVRQTADPFLKSIAFGLTMTLIAQALWNISVVLSISPNKGLPLPFISYGVNSLVTSIASIGIILSISSQNPSSITPNE